MANFKVPNSEQARLIRVYSGVESESLRVSAQGSLAQTPHPEVFGNKLHNPYFTTDYAEQQVECITQIMPNAKSSYEHIRALKQVLQLECKSRGEYLWPASLPCPLPQDSEIQIARYDDSEEGRASYAYRELLARRYGKARQMLSGVHYNFSFEPKLIESLYLEALEDGSAKGMSLREFSDASYLKVVRNFFRYGWLLLYLSGSTPLFHESFSRRKRQDLLDAGLIEVEPQVWRAKYALSDRNGRYGYRNLVPIHPDYSDVECYVQSLQAYIDAGDLSEPKEFYSPIRVKPHEPERTLESLIEDGILYLELRFLDLNPFDMAGTSQAQLEFIEAFVLFLLFAEEEDEGQHACQIEGLQNQELVAARGLKPGLELSYKGEKRLLSQWGLELLEAICDLAKMRPTSSRTQELINYLSYAKECVVDPSKTISARFLKRVEDEGYMQAHMNFAKKYQEQNHNNRWSTPGFEDWEMSTQLLIAESFKRGIKVEALDASDNFIRLSRGEKVDYVRQCTKTSRDTYMTVLLMENKVLSKIILSEAGIRVADGERFGREDAAEKLAAFVGEPCVIKPKSTNFGLGITIFAEGATFEQLMEAAEFAFGFDETVLVEEFFEGLEYRFLTIGDEVTGVLHRSPAQVKGDGVLNIRELVKEKNKHPFRSTGYRTPLVNIALGEVEEEFLSRANMSFDSVPSKDEVVLLRPNSNISTGGESFDVTDEVAPIFKEIALKSAHAFGARFCGVDMMIKDLSDPNSSYGLIEVNFNPAIHIHSFPAHGVERNIASKVLRELGFIK